MTILGIGSSIKGKCSSIMGGCGGGGTSIGGCDGGTWEIFWGVYSTAAYTSSSKKKKLFSTPLTIRKDKATTALNPIRPKNILVNRFTTLFINPPAKPPVAK